MLKYQAASDSIRRIDSQTKGSVIETIHTTKQEVAQGKQRNWYLIIIILLVLRGTPDVLTVEQNSTYSLPYLQT